MKKLFLLIMLLSGVSLYSQNDTANYVIIPVDTTLNWKKLESLSFVEKEVTDTLIGKIIVKVAFNEKINTCKHLSINEISIVRFMLESTGSEIIKIDYSPHTCQVYGEFENYIMNKYMKEIIDIYKKQPFSQMKGRQYHDYNKLSFICSFMIVPPDHSNR